MLSLPLCSKKSSHSFTQNRMISRRTSSASKLLFLFVFLPFSFIVNAAQFPVQKNQVSQLIKDMCEKTACVENILDEQTIISFLSQHTAAKQIAEAFSLSEYQVLVASALVNKQQSPMLHLEITTSWRGVPIDEYNVSTPVAEDNTVTTVADEVLGHWITHVEFSDVLNARIIYEALNASDYENQLELPNTIGDFTMQQRALYRDPMQGTIARYVHPEYSDAVFDVSVYPISPFVHGNELSDEELISAELGAEKQQLMLLIEGSDIPSYDISDIEDAQLMTSDASYKGFKLRVALNTDFEPAYSTQYVFRQGDKFVKLTGNFPDKVMESLVLKSLPLIIVPPESAFMKAMRNG